MRKKMTQNKVAVKKRAKPRPMVKRKKVARKKVAIHKTSISKWSLWSALSFGGVFKKLSYVMLIIPVVAVLFAGWWLKQPENLTLKEVSINGQLSFLNKADLEKLIEPHIKTNLHLIDLNQLEKTVEASEWVEDAAFTKVWPDQLRIDITEHTPVAFWGRDSMMGRKGDIIPISVEEFRGKLPELFSPKNNGRNVSNNFLKIKSWLRDVPLELVSFNENAQGSWQVSLDNGLILKIGKNHQKRRMQRFVVAYHKALHNKVENIRTVDLRYTNGFAVKWKKGHEATFASR